MDFAETSTKILGSSLPEALKVTQEVRERLEVVHGPEYGGFLAALFPAFKTLLLERIPVSLGEDDNTKFRRLILEILNRLPNNETLRPYTAELLDLVTTVLSVDNEENALTCLRIIFGLHKDYRSGACASCQTRRADAVDRRTGACSLCWSCAQGEVNAGLVQICLRDKVQSFLDLVQDFYRRFHGTVATNFGSSVAEAMVVETSGPETPAAASTPVATDLRGLDSFKVLTECPLIVMLLFQLYPEFISALPQRGADASGNIPLLVPLMMEGLQQPAPDLPGSLQRARYKEMVACQVKTLSFLTYLLRGFADLMRPFEDAISKAVVALMSACPGEAANTRKELLVATRHILATDFRKGFFAHVDVLLDERMLVGDGHQSFETLRPLAYSTLADLVHHVRASLNLPQLSRVVHIYSRNIHDASLPVTIQTTSVRLLLNLTDFVFHNTSEDAEAGKVLLTRILKTLVHKFDTLRAYMNRVDVIEQARATEQEQALGGTSRQLSEVIKQRQTIRSEAQSAALLIGSPGIEVEKSLFGLVAMEAISAGVLFGSGDWGFGQAIAPLGACNGNVNDSSLVSFARGVLRQSLGQERKPVPKDSQLFLGNGSVTFTFNATTEAGFPRRLCVRHLELITTEWKPKTSVTVRWRAPSAVAASTDLAVPWFEAATTTTLADGVVRVSLLADVVCSSVQLVVDTRAASPGAWVGLHEFRMVGGDPSAVPQLEEAPQLDPVTLNQKALAAVLRRTGPVNLSLAATLSAQTRAMRACSAATPGWATKSPVAASNVVDSLRDLKGLLKITLMGLKTIMWCTANYDANYRKAASKRAAEASGALVSPEEAKAPYLLNDEETDLVTKFFRWGLTCCSIYARGVAGPGLGKAKDLDDGRGAAEVKEMLEHFASSFTVIEPHNLRATVGREMSLFADLCLAQPQLYAVSQNLLANANTSAPFADVLMSFLVSRVHELVEGRAAPKREEDPPDRCDVLLQLFKMVFGSLSIFPDNEMLISRHLSGLIASALRLVAHSRNPVHLLGLLRAIFRATSGVYGSHFDSVLNEVAPALPAVVNGLLQLRSVERDPVAAALLSELCLTVPAKPEALLPFIPLLSPVLTHALRATGELAKLGLRTLEFWIDQLSPADLELGLAASTEERSELMVAVCSHLRPSPYPYGTLAIRILGKLGGRNRRFVRNLLPMPGTWATPLDTDPSTLVDDANVCGLSPNSEVFLSLALTWAQTGGEAASFALPLDPVVSSACRILERLAHHDAPNAPGPVAADQSWLFDRDSRPALATGLRNHKRYALALLKGVLAALLEPTPGSSFDLEPKKAPPVGPLVSGLVDEEGAALPAHLLDTRPKGTAVLRQCLRALVVASSDSELQDEASPLLEGAVEHFSGLIASRTLDGADGVPVLDPSIEGASLDPFALSQVLIEMICCGVGRRPNVALAALLQAAQKGGRLMAADLFGRLATLAHQSELRYKLGACRALAALCGEAKIDASAYEAELVSALLASLRDQQRERSVGLVDAVCGALSALMGGASKEPAQGTKLIVAELASPAAAVRLCAKRALFDLAQREHADTADDQLLLGNVATLMAPFVDTLRGILAGPFLGLDIARRIGLLDAVSFVLALPRPSTGSKRGLGDGSERLIPVGDILAVLDDAMVICEAEDSANSSSLDVQSSRSLRVAVHAALEPLVVNDMVVLTAALELPARTLSMATCRALHSALVAAGPAFATGGAFAARRPRFVGLFFKLLTSGGGEPVVEAAQSALTYVITSPTHNKDKPLPKDLLQECLKPVLTQIKSHTTLTKPLLKGLSRLLYLISNLFNRSLGETLLEHLARWAEPESLIAAGIWRAGEEVDVAVAVVGIFHLLPISPDFLQPLVTSVLRLEATCYLYSPSAASADGGYGSGAEAASPFREPLLKYLNRHRAEAAAYLLGRLEDESHANLLQSLLRHPKGGPLRDQIAKCPGALLEAAFPHAVAGLKSLLPVDRMAVDEAASIEIDWTASLPHVTTAAVASIAERDLAEVVEGPALDALVHGLSILSTLATFDPAFLTRAPALALLVRLLWRAPSRRRRVEAEDKLPPRLQEETRLLVTCLMSIIREHPSLDVCLELITVFLAPNLTDLTPLRDFFREEVSPACSPTTKRALVLRTLALLRRIVPASEVADDGAAMLVGVRPDSSSGAPAEVADAAAAAAASAEAAGSTPSEMAVLLLQLMVIPSLAATFESRLEVKSSVVDSGLIRALMRDGLDTAALPQHEEPLRTELLRLSTLLIENLGRELVEHRKELIKFAWNHLKSEDSTSKQWAYVNVCRFIAVYETPPKIILQVYVALLRAYQPEARELVKTSLDILVPALPRRLPASEFVKAIKWTKKIMYEEGHALPMLCHIWGLLVRHPALFYSYRSGFLPQMVQFFNRLGRFPNCALDNRILAVSLAGLVIEWELHRRERLGGGAREGDELVTSAGGAGDGDDDFTLPVPMVEMCVNFLARTAIFTADHKDPAVQRLSPRCVTLLTSALGIWRLAAKTIRFSFLEKLLSAGGLGDVEAEEEGRLSLPVAEPKSGATFTPAVLSTCLDVLIATLDGDDPNPFVLNHIGQIQLLVSPCYALPDSSEVHEKLATFLRVLTKLYPPTAPPPAMVDSSFYVLLSASMERRLQQNTTADRSEEPSPKCASVHVISVLEQLCKGHVEYAEQHCVALVKLCHRLARDHVTATSATARALQGAAGLLTDLGANAVPPRVMATPTVAILAEATSAAAAGKYVAPPALDEPMQTLIGAVRLLGASIGQTSTQAESRKTFLRLVEGLLQQSDNVALLLALVDLVGEWILNTARSPLSQKEKSVFLARLAHFPRVPEPSATPLAAKFLHLISVLSEDPATDRTLQISRPQMAGLLAADPALRAKFLRTFMGKCEKGDGSVERESEPPRTSPLCRRLMRLFTSDWEVVGNRYWLVVAVDVLLASLDGADAAPRFRGGRTPAPLRLAAPLMGSAHDKDATGGPHSAFLAAVFGSATLGALLRPLGALAHGDMALAQLLVRRLLPAAWRTLTAAEQDSLVAPLSALLAKPSLRPCLGLPAPLAMMPAGGQLLRLPVGGFSQLSAAWGWAAHGAGLGSAADGTALGGSAGPAPPPLNVVRSLLAVVADLRPLPVLPPALLASLAASHNAWHASVALLEHHTLVSPASERLDWVRCLSQVYEDLGESDRARALQQRACAARESHVALSLEAYGHFGLAQKLYLELITQENSGRGVGLKLSSFELELWEARWADCARQLSQWPLLADFSRSAKQHGLTLEAAWKSHEWATVRELLRAPSTIAALELGSPRHKLFEIYVAIVDGKFGDVEHHCNQCIQLALHRWAQLPPLATADGAHTALLGLFHQLVEVHESGQVMLEVTQHARGPSQRSAPQPDLKHIIHTWRSRLPNKWDAIPEWDELLCWRLWVFKSTAEALKQRVSDQQLLSLHDTPWTVLKKAHTARKQRLEPVALESLSLLYETRTLDVGDAYTKLREQILMCHPKSAEGKSSHKLRGGLSLVQNTNLEFFNETQRAELFRLKGTFLALLGQPAATSAYSAGAAISSEYAKNWLAWGEYCDQAAGGDAQSVACYLQALQQGSGGHRGAAKGLVVARILTALLQDTDGSVGAVVAAQGATLPASTWLPWLGLLLASPSAAVEPLLAGVARQSPQALFYPLRSFLASRRPGEAAVGESLMALLRSAHPELTTEMEFLADTLTERLQPSPEEVLLTALQRLLGRCLDAAQPAGNQISPAMIQDLAAAFASYFTAASSPLSVRLRASYERDAALAKGVLSLGQAVERLRRWRHVLEREVVLKLPRRAPLFKVAPALAALRRDRLTTLEVPGQYICAATDASLPRPELHNRLLRFGSAIGQEYRQATGVSRRVTMLGSNGKASHWVVRPASKETSRDERMAQLMLVLDDVMASHPQTRRRHVSVNGLKVVGLGNANLIEDDPSMTSLHEVYRTSSDSDPDAPLLFAREHLATITGDAQGLLREKLRVYTEVCARVPDDLLSRHVHESLSGDSEGLWALKRSMATQLAAWSMLGHAFTIGHRTPDRFVFSKRSGRFISTDFRPVYRPEGLLEPSEEVPFRLTRNLMTLLSPLLVDGVFASSMASTALALADQATTLRPYLGLVLREDLVDWGKAPLSSQAVLTENTQKNVQTVLDRLSKAAPRVQLGSEGRVQREHRVDHIVHRLIEAAAQPERLCQMPPTWMPWL